MALSNRGWTRRPTPRSSLDQIRVRTPRRSRAFTPGRVVLLLVLLVIAVLLLPRHITISGYHLHPAFAPYLAPYLIG